MANIIPVAVMIIYIVILIYVLLLLTRFVNAIEKIADKIESSSKI